MGGLRSSMHGARYAPFVSSIGARAKEITHGNDCGRSRRFEAEAGPQEIALSGEAGRLLAL
jgi:hypothetical protein